MANTFRFGSTTDPSKIVTESVQEADEYDSRANNDPNKLFQCPFDKNHQIRSCRFPYHIIKCRKNHPKLASELKTCPFNARHLVQRNELQSHIETCPDRTLMENEAETNGIYKWKVPISTWENTNLTEDWDKEVDDHAPPFVLGMKMGSDEKPTTNPTTTFKLAPGFKPPKTLPWSDF